MTADSDPKPVNVVESVPNTQSDDVDIPEFVQQLLEKIAHREGFTDGFKIISRSGSNVGDGFMGVLLSIVITGIRNDNADEELVLVCKIPPMNEMRLKLAVSPFKQEIASYEIFLPAFVEFQREKGISESDGFFAFPKCYGTHADDEKSEYALVLEDLRPKGFRMWNKYTPIDYTHVKLAISQLGKFHAISFAMRQQRPDIFAQFKTLESGMLKIMYDFPSSTGYYEKTFDKVLKALQPGDTEEIRRIQHLRYHFKSNLQLSSCGSEAEPFTVFCHGDFWNNNMMFQYNSADSMEPQRAVLIDWQISQYCSPATDLTYYLCSSTEQTLRDAHFDDILHDYHSNLSDLLQRLGGNAENQFSFAELQKQLKTFGIYGLILAPVLIQVVTVKADDLPDMDSMTEDNLEKFDLMAKGSPSGYNKRVRDVVRDFVGRGFFGKKHLALEDMADV